MFKTSYFFNEADEIRRLKQMTKPIICVVGSINMDLTVTTGVMPQQGETIIGKDVATFPGGKGANQAVAAAKLGANVSMIGAVGIDSFGETLIGHLKQERVNTEGIARIENKATGIANIILSEKDNRIIVAPGANSAVTPELVERQQHLIKNSDVILLQFEIPMETVIYTVQLAKKFGVKIIVNPALFQKVPETLYEKTTYFTPNEIEVESMQKDVLFNSVRDKMIVTLGEKGVKYVDDFGQEQINSAYQVDAVDTTGAGDTFNGALATEIASGKN